MSTAKKNSTQKSSSKKTVIVTKSKVAAKSSMFTKKVEKVNTMLGKTKWISS